MAANYKTLSAFEVATAEEAQSYFMDQAIIKVDTATDLSTLPTDVKTAYVMDTGILMARNVADAWVPMGGVATVGETAPSNPQVGQLWVKPSERLPAPWRMSDGSAGQVVTATAWGTYTPGATALSVTVDKAVMCVVRFGLWMNANGTTAVLARLKWTGALAGNSYDAWGGWGNGTLYQNASSMTSLSLSGTLVIPAGTTAFRSEAYRNGGTSALISYPNISITPVAWADEYVDGVS